jgi:hypothetical protein
MSRDPLGEETSTVKRLLWANQWWVVRDGCLVDTIKYDNGDMNNNPRLTYQEHKDTTVWLAMRVTEKDAHELEPLDKCNFETQEERCG